MSNILSALFNLISNAFLVPIYPFLLLFAANIYLALILQAIFMMCTQLFCLYVFKNKFARLLPALYCGATAVFLLLTFIFKNYFSLIMMIQLAFVISSTVGLALSLVIHLINKSYLKMRERKLSVKEGAIDVSVTEEAVADERSSYAKSVPREKEAPAFIRNIFFRKYAKKKDSGLVFRMTVPENTLEKDTGILSNIFLFVFSGIYCLSYHVVCFSMETSWSREVFTLVFGQLIIQFAMQLVFCYMFKHIPVKIFPAIHAVILFASFLILSVYFVYFDGYIALEKLFLSCLRYSSIGAIVGTVLGWVTYYGHGMKRKADSVVILSAENKICK